MSYDQAARRKTPLALALAAEIARKAPIPVADYMQRCLWDEKHGYYATRRPLGQAGDFITAPEISQVFGELIGLWSAVVWRDLMGGPAAHTLAELGPGRGTLMRDMLRATAKVPGFHSGLRCHMIEASAPLAAEQKATLAECAIPTTWGADISKIDTPAIIIANEFFDALPVHQWVKAERGWTRRSVDLDDGCQLCFGAHPKTCVRGDLDELFPNAPFGAIVGNQRPELILADIGALAKIGPVATLIIDYGHEKTALGDTLQAVRQHAHEHPLTSPGEADLSAQVDFAELAAAARKSGLAVDGPITQAEFLGRLGIVERASKLMAANPAKAGEIEFGVARLLAPDGMGARFKVLGLRSPELPRLPGFEPPQRDIATS